MAQHLPPLNSLRFFEAAARLENFRRVAEELHVTPSAVSHSILALESWIGTQLFERTPRGLVLTVSGNSFLPSVTTALGLISDATDQLSAYRGADRLSLRAEPTFASRWLMPRLARFTQSHPAISISIDTSGSPPASDAVDLEIRYSDKPPAGMCRTRLVRETLVPVCSPALVGRIRLDHRQLLRCVSLLKVPSLSEDWKFWMAAAGIELDAKTDDIGFGAVQMALEAAKEGLGIAIGRLLLIESDLAFGSLVELDLPRVAGQSSYWLIGAGPTFERRETRAFRRWLINEMRFSTPGAGGRLDSPVPGKSRLRCD
jgi:LysR family transcriptional regulator, glycine cleavage system transcriptional activator